MARILGVGIATVDVINIVDHYPHEDEEMRAYSQRIVRGGNSCNTLCVLSQLGHKCEWKGTLVREPDADIIIRDLDQFRVGHQTAVWKDTGKVPTSYITLNQANGSRTIVHFRDLEELSNKEITKQAFENYDWIHFEGRNIEAVRASIIHIKKKHPNIPISLEVEKERRGIETLFTLVDLLLFSKNYVVDKGYSEAKDFFRNQNFNIPMVCAWGEAGSYAWQKDKHIHCAPAQAVSKIIDSIGAGDTFNAGIIHSLIHKATLEESLKFANRLATKKIQQYGFAALGTSKKIR